jgi:hypothetical protein
MITNQSVIIEEFSIVHSTSTPLPHIIKSIDQSINQSINENHTYIPYHNNITPSLRGRLTKEGGHKAGAAQTQ